MALPEIYFRKEHLRHQRVVRRGDRSKRLRAFLADHWMVLLTIAGWIAIAQMAGCQ